MAEKKNTLLPLKEKLNSGSLSGLYLFTGEETFNKNFYISKFRDAFADNPMPEFNVMIFDGKEISHSMMLGTVESYPVMSDNKLIIIKNSGIFKSVSEEDKGLWMEIFENPPSYATIIFDESETDGRSALLKKIKECGIYTVFDYQDNTTLSGWITKYLSMRNVKIRPEATAELISRAGPSMGNICNEMNKLLDFVGENGTVSLENVCFIVAKSLQDKIFDMLDYVVTGNREKAFSILSDLKILREEPTKIIALLGNTITNLLKTKSLLKEGSTDIASDLGLPPFVARKYIQQAKNISFISLKSMINLCLEADVTLKTIGGDKWVILDTLVVEISKNKHPV